MKSQYKNLVEIYNNLENKATTMALIEGIIICIMSLSITQLMKLSNFVFLLILPLIFLSSSEIYSIKSMFLQINEEDNEIKKFQEKITLKRKYVNKAIKFFILGLFTYIIIFIFYFLKLNLNISIDKACKDIRTRIFEVLDKSKILS